MLAGGGANAQAIQLIDLIQNTIEPDSWQVNGGKGSIYYFDQLKVLVIRQTGEVHHQLGGVLGQLRGKKSPDSYARGDSDSFRSGGYPACRLEVASRHFRRSESRPLRTVFRYAPGASFFFSTSPCTAANRSPRTSRRPG